MTGQLILRFLSLLQGLGGEIIPTIIRVVVFPPVVDNQGYYYYDIVIKSTQFEFFFFLNPSTIVNMLCVGKVLIVF